MRGIFGKTGIVMFFALLTSLGCVYEVDQPVKSDPNVVINIPQGDGNPVLLDGMFSAGEWDDALMVSMNDSITLYFKKYRGHFYLGVYTPIYAISVPNAFFQLNDSSILQLHVSAQLGERLFKPGSAYNDDAGFNWGYSDGWYANESRWDQNLRSHLIDSIGQDNNEAFEMSMFPREGTEIQILQSKLQSDSPKFRIEILIPPEYDGHNHFPSGTKINNTDGWTTLIF